MELIQKYILDMNELNKTEKELFQNKYLKHITTENLNIIDDIIDSDIPDLIINDIIYSLLKQIMNYDINEFNCILNIHLMIWTDFLNRF